MSSYVVRFFKENPFDKSECNQNVQVLCDRETEKPFGILDSELNLEGQTVSDSQMESEWVSKKSKHIVPGDTVVFGQFNKYEGVVTDIVDNEEDYGLDMCLVKNITSNFNKVPALAQLNNGRVEEDRHMLRKNLQAKPWIEARIIDNSFAWIKLKEKFFEFCESQPNNEEMFAWWRKQFENKI